MELAPLLCLFLFLNVLTAMQSLQLTVADGSLDQQRSECLENSQQSPLWVRMAHTALALWNTSGPGGNVWNYQRGTLLYGFQSLFMATGDMKYFQFIQNQTDTFIKEDGSISTYSFQVPAFSLQDYRLDSICSGLNVLFLYKYTHLEKYRKAATLLQVQLKTQPRTLQGGYWHQLVVPWQMWLDGLFMAEPFRAQYVIEFNEFNNAFDDIALQFIMMEENARDSKTGLLYHGWDETRLQTWANPLTGTSRSFWGRAMGWYAMALVEVLEYFPQHHPKRDQLVQIFQRLAVAVAAVQDPGTGVWWQVLDQGGKKGNYLESSASCMFVYALAKGAHKGYLSPHYLAIAKLGYEGIKTQFILSEPGGGVSLNQTCIMAGLGGGSNGTYEYYIGQKGVTNDPKGIGPFLLASIELCT